MYKRQYECIAAGLTTHIKNIKAATCEQKTASVFNISGAKLSGKHSFYWRGFVSPVGTGRPQNHKAAYLQSHTNPYATRGGGGGKVRSACHSLKSFHTTPYRGGRERKK